ncbi:MAG: hypothetical protein ACRDSJ_23720, partial [Rubrobacteraceae bacterium]
MRSCKQNEESIRPKVGWREAAIAEAASEDYGYEDGAFGKLLAAVRLNLPGSAQVVVHDADV